MFRNKTDTWCTVTVKREGQECHEITSTPGHKYYLPNNTIIREQNERQEHDSYMGLSNKWVSAIHLKKGDRVLLSDDTYGIIQSVTTLHLSTPETTYNFEVQDYHTYFVGNGVCVHNRGCGGDYYRGGNDFSAKPGDVKYTHDGLVKTTHGVSVNTNPSAVAKHGIPHKVIDLPDGLTIIQRGLNATHYEIVASYQMTFSQYQSLLSNIVAISS